MLLYPDNFGRRCCACCTLAAVVAIYSPLLWRRTFKNKDIAKGPQGLGIMPFPITALDPGAERRAFEAAESGLLFLFEDEGLHRNTQAQLISGGYRTTDMFARYGGSETEIRENLVEDFDLKKGDGLESKAEISRVLVAWGKAKTRSDETAKSRAEAKAAKSLHVIEAGDLALLRRAYQAKWQRSDT